MGPHRHPWEPPARSIVQARVSVLRKNMLLASLFAALAAILLLPAFLLRVPNLPRRTSDAASPEDAPFDPEAAREAFQIVYSLGDHQAVRYIPPPYSTCRSVVQPDPDIAMLVRWSPEQGARAVGTFTRREGYYLEQLLEEFLHVPMSEMAGDRQDRLLSLPGDFIVRENASRDDILADIAFIFRQYTGIALTIGFRDIDQETYVLRGTWSYHPIPGVEHYAAKHNNDPNPQIHIYAYTTEADRWDPYDWLEGRNNLALALSSRFHMPVDIEATGIPALTVYNHDEREAGHDVPGLHEPTRILPHIAEQTGLTWRREVRRHRRLVVARQ